MHDIGRTQQEYMGESQEVGQETFDDGGVPMVGAVEVMVKFMPELGGNHPILALAAQRFADQLLGVVVAVAFRSVDQIQAFINGQLTATITDDGITAGGYALLVGPGTAARFDNMALRGIPPQ